MNADVRFAKHDDASHAGALTEMMEVGAEHVRAGGLRGRDQLRFKRRGVRQTFRRNAAKIREYVTAGGIVRCGHAAHHLCDPPDDQPELPDELLPQLLLLPLLLPLPMRAPGELAPVVAMITTKAYIT